MKQMNYEQALSRAASLCSGAEHSSAEIREKLIRWGISPSEVDQAITYLINEKYIDDSRFCRAYCRDKVRYNHWGRVKVRLMLRQMGIDASDIDQGIAALDPEEYSQSLLEAFQQKDRSLHDEDEYTRRGKLIRHLLSRGYEMDLIQATFHLEE